MIRRFSLAVVLSVAAATAALGAQDRTAYRATELIQRWRIIINTIFEERRASAEEPISDAIEIAISPGAVKATQDAVNEQRPPWSNDSRSRWSPPASTAATVIRSSPKKPSMPA
jgi:hypothetical protein